MAKKKLTVADIAEALIPEIINNHSYDEIDSFQSSLLKPKDLEIVKRDVKVIYEIAKNLDCYDFYLTNENDLSLNQKGYDYFLIDRKTGKKLKIQYKFKKGRELASPGFQNMLNDNDFEYFLRVDSEFQLFIDRVDEIINETVLKVGSNKMYNFILSQDQFYRSNAKESFEKKGKEIISRLLGSKHNFLQDNLNILKFKNENNEFCTYSLRYFFQYMSNHIEDKYNEKYNKSVNIIEYFEENIEIILKDYVQELFHKKLMIELFYKNSTHLDVLESKDDKIYIIENGKLVIKPVLYDYVPTDFYLEDIRFFGQGLNFNLFMTDQTTHYKFQVELRNSNSKYSTHFSKLSIKDFKIVDTYKNLYLEKVFSFFIKFDLEDFTCTFDNQELLSLTVLSLDGYLTLNRTFLLSVEHEINNLISDLDMSVKIEIHPRSASNKHTSPNLVFYSKKPLNKKELRKKNKDIKILLNHNFIMDLVDDLSLKYLIDSNYTQIKKLVKENPKGTFALNNVIDVEKEHKLMLKMAKKHMKKSEDYDVIGSETIVTIPKSLIEETTYY